MVHIFIINSLVVDKKVSDNLRRHLEKRNDIKWFAFNTSHTGMETEITQKMIQFFDGEKIRFYCCGGSGTVRNVMHGTGDYKDVEIAFYPCGSTNDFLKVYGEDQKLFNDIDNLIDGRVEKIDYIKTNYGVALNTLSLGIDSQLSYYLTDASEYSIFGNAVPYFIAYMKAIVKMRPRMLNIQVADKTYNDNISEMIVANGCVLGGGLYIAESANFKDGLLEYFIAPNASSIGLLKIILKMMNKKTEEVKKEVIFGEMSVMEIRSEDEKSITFNLDGEIVRGGSYWKIEAVKKGMSFIVPHGVKSIS